MKKKREGLADAADPSVNSGQDLRRHAEARLSKSDKRKTTLPATKAETMRLVHELQVHQIELEMQNEELAQSRADVETLLRQYTDLYDFAPLGYFTLARDGAIHQVNLAGANLLGAARGKLIERRFGLFVPDESRATFNAFLARAFESNRKETCEVALRRDGDELLWVRLEATLSEDGQREACRAIVVDITERKRAEEKTAQLAAIVESSDDVIIRKTLDGIITSWNKAAERIYGYAESEMIGKPISILAPPEHADEVPQILQKIKSGSRIDHFETVRQRKGGQRIHMSLTVSPITNAEGRIIAASTIGRDITARKQADEELRRLNTHDGLTGLYNRGFFVEEMARLERGREFPVSIVMADVDDLKETNDQQGHAAGDAMLKRVAQVLTAAFRAEDLVARIGGDEFAVLLPATDATAARVSLQRVRQVIQENNAAHTGTPIRLSLGVGTAENPTPLSAVLKEADANMYGEKRGHNAS